LDSSEWDRQKYTEAAAVLAKKISIETGKSSGEIPDVWMESVEGNENSLKD
jgi:hypothetical protein